MIKLEESLKIFFCHVESQYKENNLIINYKYWVSESRNQQSSDQDQKHWNRYSNRRGSNGNVSGENKDL